MPALTPEAWAHVRAAYEHTDRPIEAICAEHGISSGTLRDRMRRWQWTRRRPPVPREGPAAVIAPERPPAAGDFSPFVPVKAGTQESEIPQQSEGVVTPTPTLPLSGGESAEAVPQEETTSPQRGPRFRGDERVVDDAAIAAPATSDPAAIAGRLHGAVGRVVPAIEAAIAKLGAGAQHPREMEQTARALGTLMRTLRELNGLLAQHSPPSPSEDSDALRLSIAQKLTNMLAQEREDVPRRYLAAWLGQADGTAGET